MLSNNGHEIEKLRENLVWIYQKYLEDPNDKRMLELSKKVHAEFFQSLPQLTWDMQRAVRKLFGIGYSQRAKPLRADVIFILKTLKK